MADMVKLHILYLYIKRVNYQDIINLENGGGDRYTIHEKHLEFNY